MPFNQGYAPGMPGVGSSVFSRGRQIWAGMAGVQYLPIGGIIDTSVSRDIGNVVSSTAGYGENMTEPAATPTTAGVSNVALPPGAVADYSGILRAGLLMGKITSAASGSVTSSIGKYRPSIIGTVLGGSAVGTPYASGETALRVSAATAAELQRLLTLAGASIALTIVGPPSAAGTVASISTTLSVVSGTVLTITNLAANMINGAFICPADGSQNPITFVDEQFGLNILDGRGNALTISGASGNSAYGSPFPRIPIAGGTVNVNNIVNYPTDTSLITWVKSKLQSRGAVGTGSGGTFSFTDDFGL